MPTFREVEKATGASRFLMRTLVEELDPDCEHRHKEGQSWVIDDYLAHLVAQEAVKRRRERKVTDATPDTLQVVLEAHEREIATLERQMDDLKDAHAREMDRATDYSNRLQALLDERDRENDRLRTELVEARADADGLRESLTRVTGASPWSRAFRLPKLLGAARQSDS